MPRWRDDPSQVRPMLASVDEPPIAQPGLFYEPKYDGIRALVDVVPSAKRSQPAGVRLFSRNGNEKSAQFPAIVGALQSLAAGLDGPVLIDGEIVAINPAGRPLGFQHLQGRIHLTSPVEIAQAEADQPAALVMFDLLRDGDEDLRGQPLAARRLKLQERIKPAARLARLLRLSEMTADNGRALYAQAEREGWEGLIAKDGRSLYATGKRSPAWRKLKLQHQQEFVVGGWTEPRQSRTHFGALLVGYYEGSELRYAGSVGTGFDQQELDRVSKLLAARASSTSPFAAPIKTMERPHWVKPDLVAQVRFTEFTSDGFLRHPVYLGLRDDKPARKVRRETARASSSSARDAAAQPSDDTVSQLQAMEDAKKDGDLLLPNGDRLRVTNLRKVFWPKLGITKGELLRYYAAVAPMILPAVADRPLVMKRFPNGIDKQAFYQQRHPEAVPPGVRREVLPPDVDPIDEEGPRDRLIGGSLTTLLYMTQLAAISQDPWFSRVSDPLYQDVTAIDLDPGEGAGITQVLDVARWVKDALDRLEIPAVPKTSGSRGIHIYIPLPKKTTYETGQVLCQMIATFVATRHPKVATVERMVKRRPRGTVYVDYLQNILGKTLATVYSARASDYAGVSTPLTWQEIADGVDPREFTIRTALGRFQKTGDLWAKLRTSRPANLKEILKKQLK